MIYYPTVMALYSLFVLKVPLNTKQTNKQSVHYNGHLSRWTWVSQYQNVCILDFKWRIMEVEVSAGAVNL